MSLVEQKYNEALNRMSGAERVERTLSLFQACCEMLALQISKSTPGLSERALKKKVAQRLYMSDEGAQKLLARIVVD